MTYAFTKYSGFKYRPNYHELKPALDILAKEKMEMIQDEHKGRVYFVSTLQYPLVSPLSTFKQGLHIDIVTDHNMGDQTETITVDGKRYRVYVRYHEYYPSECKEPSILLRSDVDLMLENRYLEMFWLFYQITSEENTFVYIDQEFKTLILNLFNSIVKTDEMEHNVPFVPDLTNYLVRVNKNWGGNLARHFETMFEEEFLSSYDEIHERCIILSRLQMLLYILKLITIEMKTQVSNNGKFNMSLFDRLYHQYIDESTSNHRYTYKIDIDIFNSAIKDRVELLIGKTMKLFTEVNSINVDRTNIELYDATCRLATEVSEIIKERYGNSK